MSAATAPATATAPAAPAAAPPLYLLLPTIFLLNATEFLQVGMMAFGAVPIMGVIGASPEQYSIVTAIYACVAIAVIAKQRWLVERLGWRAFIQGSVAMFIAGAAICATSSAFPQFVLGRAVMGLGGAAFMTSARLLVNLIPPSPKRFVGIVAFAVALAIGNAAAPWTVALFVADDQVSAIFVLLAGVALAGALVASVTLPSAPLSAAQHTQAHPWPLAVMAGGSFLLLYALQRAQYDFYSGLPALLALGAAGLAGVLYFIRQQSRHPRPLLAFARLNQPRYLMGLAIFTLCYIVLGANNTMLPVLMQRGLGYSWHTIGLVLSLGLIAALFAFAIKARLLPTSPAPRKFYVGGFAALAFCGWQLSRLNGEANLWTDVLPGIAGFGAFIIPVMATTALHGFSELQKDAVAFDNGQQFKNMLSQFGLAFGIAAATLAHQWRSAFHYATLTTRFAAGDGEFTARLTTLTAALAPGHGEQAGALALAQLAQTLTQQATLLASLDYFRFLMLTALVCAALMWLQRTMR